MPDSARTRIAEIARYWNEVEQRAKEAEHFREEAIMAAINEMRYAGRRLVDVLDQLEDNGWEYTQQAQDDLMVAHNYLINADHDITDGVCFFAHRRIRKVLEYHGVRKLRRLCPDYEKLYPEITRAQAIMQASRRDRMKRKAEYDRLAKDYVPKIMELYEKVRTNFELRIPDDLPAKLSFFKSTSL